MKEAEKEKQEGVQGQWQQESPAKEYLEHVKCCKDTDCTPRMMKQGVFCVEKWRVGGISKASLRWKQKATEWAFERIREKVAEEEAGRLSIAQRIILKSTDYLRCIIAPSGGFQLARSQQLVVRNLWRKT